MIFSNIDFKETSLAPPFKRVLQYLRENDLRESSEEEIELDGRNIYLKIQEIVPQPMTERKIESHKKYVDLQFILSGEEKMGFLLLTKDAKVIEENVEGDLFFYQPDFSNESFLHLKSGDFVIFFPEDLHRPGCQVDCQVESSSKPVRKVVAKIHVDLLSN